MPVQYSDLGDLVSIDGSLINAVLTMYWADYRKGSKKAKGHFGFDVNRQIPLKVYLTDGNGAERPFVSSILAEGQTGIMDRGYQSHEDFDFLQAEKKTFCMSNQNQNHTNHYQTEQRTGGQSHFL